MKSVYLFIVFSVLVGSAVFYLDKAGLDTHYYAQAPITRVNKFDAPTDIPGFTKLDEPINVIWTGQVISVMGGGQTYAIKKLSKDPEYPYFMAQRMDDKDVWLDGLVQVTGKFIGIDCYAYQSIFHGCVRDVEIEEIRSIDGFK